MQRFFRRKRDRVQQDIELPPFLFDSLEYLLRLPFDIDIQRHENRRFQFSGERVDKPFRAIVQVGHSQLGAQGPKCFGTPPGNRLIVGDPYNQAFSSLKGNLSLRKQWNGHNALARVEVVGCIFQGRDTVCSACSALKVVPDADELEDGLVCLPKLLNRMGETQKISQLPKPKYIQLTILVEWGHRALACRLSRFTRSMMPTKLPNVPQSVAFSDADRCAQAIVDSVGYDLRLAVPMSIGKPILIVDALYRLAEADRRVQLTIFTGLTLTLPRPRSSLERRFAEPLLDRVFFGCVEPLYAAAEIGR